MSTTPHLSVGVIGAPDLARALKTLGVDVVGGGDFRDAAQAIRLHTSPLPVIAIESDRTGFRGWIEKQASLGAAVVVLSANPAAGSLALPGSLGDIITAAGLPALPDRYAQIVVEADGSIPQLQNPAAYMRASQTPSPAQDPSLAPETTHLPTPHPIEENRAMSEFNTNQDQPNQFAQQFPQGFPPPAQPIPAPAHQNYGNTGIQVDPATGQPVFPAQPVAQPVHPQQPVLPQQPIAPAQPFQPFPSLPAAPQQVNPFDQFPGATPAGFPAQPTAPAAQPAPMFPQQGLPVQQPIPAAQPEQAQPFQPFGAPVAPAPAPAAAQPFPSVQPPAEAYPQAAVEQPSFPAPQVPAAQFPAQPAFEQPIEPAYQPVQEQPYPAPLEQAYPAQPETEFAGGPAYGQQSVDQAPSYPVAAPEPAYETSAYETSAYETPAYEAPAQAFEVPVAAPAFTEPAYQQEPVPAGFPPAFGGAPAGDQFATFDESSRSFPEIPDVPDDQLRAQIIVSYGAKGGVGKTTCAVLMAQRAAAAGLRVVVVDMNRGQGNIKSYLRLDNPNLPTVYNAAVTGRAQDALISPRLLRENRDPSLPGLGFAVVMSPPHTLADPRIVTAGVYHKVIRFIQSQADLVIIDTQIVEAKDTSGLIDRVLTPLLKQGAWGLGVSDMSRPGREDLLIRTKSFIQQGAHKERLLLMVNKAPQFGPNEQALITESFGAYSAFLGAAGEDPELAAAMNAGSFDVQNSTLRPILDSALYQATGNEAFLAEQPSKKRGGLFGRRR